MEFHLDLCLLKMNEPIKEKNFYPKGKLKNIKLDILIVKQKLFISKNIKDLEIMELPLKIQYLPT